MNNLWLKIKRDSFRYVGDTNKKFFCYRHYPGFRYMFWLRVCSHYRNKNIFYFFVSRIILNHLSFKYGMDIPYDTEIGDGFYIGHFGGIVISSEAILGKNVNISQGVTIGTVPRGKNKGAPTIGDSVYIGPGAKIIGNIKIGSNVAIGANAVVCSDVPDGMVVGGIPSVCISNKGSRGYCINEI